MSASALAFRLSLFYGLLFLGVGVSLPFWPVWLASRGMGPSEISLLMAAAYITRTIANPFVGALADRRGDRRRPMLLLALMSLGAYVLFLFAGSFWALMALTILVSASFNPVTPLGDSLTLLKSAEVGLDYGRIRLWGSLTFVGAAYLGGAMLERCSTDVVLWLIIGSMVGLVGGCLALPDVRFEKRADRPASPVSPGSRAAGKRPMHRLLAHPVFFLFLAAASLIQVSHMVYYAFSTLHWQKAGLTGDTIGLLWAEGVLAEVILFAVSAAVLRRIGPAHLLVLAGLAGAVRWTVLGLTTEPLVLIFIQALHAFSFGACHIGAMHFIGRAAPRSLSAGAQGLYTSVASGLMPGLAMLVVGPLYDAFAGGAFVVAAGAALIAAFLALALLRRWNGGELALDDPGRLTARAEAR